MDSSAPLPQAPLDLWPKVPAVQARRPAGHLLMVEIPGLSDGPLLTALARSVHFAMHTAGGSAARSEAKRVTEGSSPQAAKEVSLCFAEEAARLLSIYTAVHGASPSIHEFHITPSDLKEKATRSYQLGFRNEREFQQSHGVAFNDALYESVKPGARISRPDSKPHRHP
jgi:hypothetical protein